MIRLEKEILANNIFFRCFFCTRSECQIHIVGLYVIATMYLCGNAVLESVGTADSRSTSVLPTLTMYGCRVLTRAIYLVK